MTFSSMHFLADNMILFFIMAKFSVVCKYMFFILSSFSRYLDFFLEEILKYILEGQIQNSLSNKYVL